MEQKFSWTILIEPPSTDEDERAEENLSQQVSRDLSEATGWRLGEEEVVEWSWIFNSKGWGSFCYKMNKFMVIIVCNIVLYAFAKRVDLKCSHYKKKVTVWGYGCVN